MKIKYYIPVILWMIFIFYMSHQDGTSSSGMSGHIVTTIHEFVTKFFPVDISIDTLSFIIRKGAHITEYMILTFLFIYALIKTNIQKYLIVSAFASLLYACSDELHQTFIPGRAGSIVDVGIDSIGIVIALLIFYLFNKLYLHKKTA